MPLIVEITVPLVVAAIIIPILIIFCIKYIRDRMMEHEYNRDLRRAMVDDVEGESSSSKSHIEDSEDDLLGSRERHHRGDDFFQDRPLREEDYTFKEVGPTDWSSIQI